MGGVVFPPCYLTWGQTMVEVMKIMATSFKRSHALSAPDPAAGHSWPMPLPETPNTHGQVWLSLLWGHCSFLLGPGAHKFLFVPSKSLLPQSCVSSSSSMVGFNGHLLQEGLCHTQVYAPRAPAPAAVHCWPVPPQETPKYHSVSISMGSLCPGMHKVYLSLLSISGGY